MDTLQFLPNDEFVSLRVFTDLGMLEVYWMDGRVAITSPFKVSSSNGNGAEIFASTNGIQLVKAMAWEMDTFSFIPTTGIV